jgi:beta-glucuronidase
MSQFSRRHLLQRAAALTAAVPAAAGAEAINTQVAFSAPETEIIPLAGEWRFIALTSETAPALEASPEKLDASAWERIRVPHTWQTIEGFAEFRGTALYRTQFFAPAAWAEKVVRIEFEAVTHSATVWVNNLQVGEHLRKGYTAWKLDITRALQFGAMNTLTVRVDNRFNTRMLPREKSYDWCSDGGIIRPVSLLVTPPVFIEGLEVEAEPLLNDSKTDLKSGVALSDLKLRAVVRNAGKDGGEVRVKFAIREEPRLTANLAAYESRAQRIGPGATETFLAAGRDRLQLWHFDRPHLYGAVAELEWEGRAVHTVSQTFGARKFEVKDGGFHLNGERVRLMGVERMAGSHPDHGMAEPASWMEHDHRDLKELNCVFTRVHWPQDRRVLDFCDRHGILMQEEVPAWGPDTFAGMSVEPSNEIMQNGLEQLREMIARDRHHPSIVAWGLCNEVNGQSPPAQKFIRRMAEEARKFDPARLLTYASHSLYQHPELDVAGELDFISFNEYYGSWRAGDAGSLRENLKRIHQAFPAKPIVISEYGFCECAPGHQGGDARRIDILRNHTAVMRESEFVAGAIFFCYNDYRTHIGDKGVGALQQRVHGVVDVYGNRKPSFEALRAEASPFSELTVVVNGRWITASLMARNTLPSYTLEGYTMRAIVYGFGDLPMEQTSVALPRLAPGEGILQEVSFEEQSPRRIRVDLLRPSGDSAITAWWTPS